MLENDLRRAIDSNELEVYYQPQLTLNNRKVFGAEALVRWHHPEFGLLTPSEFLHISEDAGLIASLGEWVLRTACKQMVRWKKENSCINTLAVNLSNAQLSSIDLVETVAKILDETSCDAKWLELEITEDFIMKETEHSSFDFVIFGRVHDSQNHFYLSLATPGYLQQPKNKNHILFQNTIAGNLEMLAIEQIRMLKRRAPKTHEDPY